MSCYRLVGIEASTISLERCFASLRRRFTRFLCKESRFDSYVRFTTDLGLLYAPCTLTRDERASTSAELAVQSLRFTVRHELLGLRAAQRSALAAPPDGRR